MGQNLGVYSPKDVSLIIQGRNIEGLTEGEFIRVERNNEADFTSRAGAKGDYTFVENLDKSGNIIFILKQNASDNTFVRSLLESKTVFSVQIVSKHNYQELVSATSCMVGVAPRKVYGQDELDREWSLAAGEIIETDKTL